MLWEWCLSSVPLLHLHLHEKTIASSEADAEEDTTLIFCFLLLQMMQTITALNIVYQKRRYIAAALAIFIVALSLNYYSLIMVVPGSSLMVFLKTSAWWQVVLPLTISLLIAILIGMQVYLLRQRFDQTTIPQAGIGTASSGAGIIGSVIGSAGCLSCLTVLLSFLGVGVALTLLKYRYYIIVASLVLLLLSIHLTAKSILCKECSGTQRK